MLNDNIPFNTTHWCIKIKDTKIGKYCKSNELVT